VNRTQMEVPFAEVAGSGIEAWIVPTEHRGLVPLRCLQSNHPGNGRRI